MSTKRKVHKLHNITLRELSLVDRPASPGATVLIAKRDDGGDPQDVEKGMHGEDDEAKDFTEALAGQQAERAMWAMRDKLYTFTDALQRSLCSIWKDEDVTDKGAAVAETLMQFNSAVLALSPAPAAADYSLPGVLTALGKSAADAASTQDEDVSDMDIEKLAASLDAAEGKLAELEKALGEKDAEIVTLTKRAEDAEAAVAKGKGGKDKKDGEEEENEEGKPDFMKSLPEDVRKYMADIEKRAADAEAIAKAERDARELVQLEKRAEAEIPNLPGTATEKARVLKAIGGLEEPVRKSLDAMLKAGDAAMADKLVEVGKSGGSPSGATGALGKLEAKAAEIQKNNPSLSAPVAFSKACDANPDLYAEYANEVRGRR